MGFSYERETDKYWLTARSIIMRKFTAKSLANQSDMDFEWHILVKEETKEFIEDQFYSDGLDYSILTPEESDNLILEQCRGYDDLLLVRLNSDDCYHSKLIKTIREFDYTEEKEA